MKSTPPSSEVNLSTQVTKWSFVALALFTPLALMAQEEPDDDDVYELAPFEVSTSRDRGYTATSSLSGGRLATDLRDTAAAVTVLTEEFLADIAATSFLEAAAWAPNAVPQEEIDGANIYNDYSVRFRGLSAGFQSRNYFRWYINSDSYNTDRIDFSRGPNSIVFGDAGVGGVANVSSMRAYGSKESNLALQWSSWGGARLTADTDIPVNESFSLRVAGLYQRFDDWRDVGGTDREGFFVTGTYYITPQTYIRAEFEYGNLHRLITFGTLEASSNWDGVTTVSEPLPAGVPVPGGLFRQGSNRIVLTVGDDDLGLIDWRTWGGTGGTYRQLLPEPQPGLPESLVIPDHEISFQAENAGVENPYWTGSIFFNHTFTPNLFLEIALNYQEQERRVKRWFFDGILVDVNEFLPSGEPNPYLGQSYGEARYWTENQLNEVFAVRASLAYIWETSWTQQRILLSTGYRHDRFESESYEYVRTDGTNPDVTSAANRIYARRYESLLGNSVPAPPAVDPVSGIQTRNARTRAFFSEKPIAYGQLAVQGRWLDEKLVTLLGMRYDNYHENINERASDVRDPVTKEFLAFGQKIKADEQDVWSATASAVYHVTDMFSLFANYAESYDPGSTAIGINGDSLKPLLSEGLEGGLRVNLLDGRLVGSITYYTNEQVNDRIRGESGSINAIWGFLDMEDELVDNYSDRQSFKGSGWEFDFTAMPTENWRLFFNFSIPETELVDGYFDTRDYFNQNVAFWNSEADRLEAEGEAILADAVRSNITNIENSINSFAAGRRLDDTFRYTANIFTRYYFAHDTLKGFSIGGGANFRGERLVANQPGGAFDYVYADDYMLISLVVGYERELGSGLLSLQLNVSNLFDEEIVRPTSYGVYSTDDGSVFVPDRFTVQAPRRFLLTANYKF